ncbi:hypothetical protein ACWEFJ_38235 [Actinosynnema sp. NPDC004786]
MLREQVLPLSSWLDEHAAEYYDRIRAVVDGGPIEDWIEFFAGIVGSQARAQLSLVEQRRATHRTRLVSGTPRTLGQVRHARRFFLDALGHAGVAVAGMSSEVQPSSGIRSPGVEVALVTTHYRVYEL